MTDFIDFKEEEVYEEDQLTSFLEFEEDYKVDSSKKPEKEVELNPFTGQPRRPKTAGVSPYAKKRPKGHVRSQFNTVDHLVLSLLNSFRFISIEQTSQLLGVKNLSASKRLAGLAKAGLLRAERPYGYRSVYCLTHKGRKELVKAGLTHRAIERPTFKSDHATNEIPHDLAIMQMIVNELSGNGRFLQRVIRARFPDGIPTYDKDVHGAREPFYRALAQTKLDWFTKYIVSEYTIKYSYEDKNGRYSSDNALSPAWRASKLKHEYHELLKQGKKPAVDTGLIHPELFMHSADNRDIATTKRFWTPDMVINFESVRRGVEPVSYFVEVERSRKTHVELVKILNTYAASFEECPMFKQVVYVVHKKKVHTALVNAIQASNIDPKRIAIVWLDNAYGEEITNLERM